MTKVRQTSAIGAFCIIGQAYLTETFWKPVGHKAASTMMENDEEHFSLLEWQRVHVSQTL